MVAAARAHPFRRHLPAAIFLGGLVALIAAVARPQAPLLVPADRSAIVLALDVSGSMRSQDVTVYTVGVGQPLMPSNAWTIGGPLDEEELQTIAREAGGRYYRASSAERLREVYRRLARSVGWERQTQEITGPVGMLGGLVVILAVIASRMLTHPLRIQRRDGFGHDWNR